MPVHDCHDDCHCARVKNEIENRTYRDPSTRCEDFISPAGVLLRCHAPPAAAATPTAVPRLAAAARFQSNPLSLSQRRKGGGRGGGVGDRPPLIGRRPRRRSTTPHALQSLLQNETSHWPTHNPSGKRGSMVWVLATRPFVSGKGAASAVSGGRSGQRQLCRPPYHIQHPVSTRPSRLVGGVCSFERGLPLSGVPAVSARRSGRCVRAVSC